MTSQQLTELKEHKESLDGSFYYTCKGSRTFCRPSCRSKTVRENDLLVFGSVKEAQAAGYQPCKRCHPELASWKGAKYDISQKATAYLQAHYREKFSLEEIANALYIDRIYLSKCFKNSTGDTLLHCHNRLRCEKAAELLLNTEYSIDFISSKVGYATSSHFARVFREFYGCSPARYRKTAYAK